jgi:hypothetical protein
MAIKGKSKWYNDLGRNKPNNKINPKMLKTKEELGLDRVPEYYKGKNGYEARKVCDNFDLSYHIGTAVTYLLRSKRKHESPIECLQKAINHIQFEIENYESNKG